VKVNEGAITTYLWAELVIRVGRLRVLVEMGRVSAKLTPGVSSGV
jgi:hypothetical protein